MTYGALFAQSERYSRRLAGCIPDGATVVVESEKSPQFIALLIALGLTGLTPLVVPARLGHEVRTRITEQAGIGYVVSMAPDHSIEVGETGAAGRLNGDSPLCLTTSGSTGVPKVVRLTPEGIGAFFDWSQEYFAITAADRILSIAPFNFDLSLLEVWSALDAGAEVMLANPERCAEGGYLADLCREAKPDLIQAIPLFHDRLCAATVSDRQPGFEPRHVIVTGEASPRSLRHRMASLFPKARFHNLYGSTETNDSFVLSLGAAEFAKPEKLGIGVPIADTAFRIVEEADTPAQGELHTATPFLASGYADTEQTEKAFLSEFENGRFVTYFRTGDRVRRHSDGTLELLGRVDFVVKLRGVRTNLLDVEQALRHHPAVQDVATLPYLDPATGQQQLVAIIEADESLPVSTLDMRAHCAAHLPKSAVPSRYVLTRSPLPKTSTGKINRGVLRQQFTQNLEISQ